MTGDWLVRADDGRWAYGLWHGDWPGAACACGSTDMDYTHVGADRYARTCTRCQTRVTPDVVQVGFRAHPDVWGLLPVLVIADGGDTWAQTPVRKSKTSSS